MPDIFAYINSFEVMLTKTGKVNITVSFVDVTKPVV